jgi:hypothetical protein
MIVKDEALTIREVLEAAKPHVDRWTILDTGSTDGTQDIVREVMSGIPGRLVEEPFVGCKFECAPELSSIIDFAATRNRSLDLDLMPLESEISVESGRPAYLHAEIYLNAPPLWPAEFQLVLSGDEYLREGEKLREALERERESGIDCYFLRVVVASDDKRLDSPRVFRSGSNWRYEKPIHELPCNRAEPSARVAFIATGAWIEHAASDPERRLQAIEEKHIHVLRAMLEENPIDDHALRFLAQSYQTIAQFQRNDGEGIELSMLAMSAYLRLLRLSEVASAAERVYLKTNYLMCAIRAGVYSEAELYAKAEELTMVDDSARPEAALLCARLAPGAKKSLSEVYRLAKRAAEIAERAATEGLGYGSPISTACLWQAHQFAAICARQIAKKYPEWDDVARAHIRAGIGAGGRWEDFRPIAPPDADAADSAEDVPTDQKFDGGNLS